MSRKPDERGYDEAVRGRRDAHGALGDDSPPPTPDSDAPLFDPDADNLEAHRAPPSDGGAMDHPVHDSDSEDILQEDYEADIERERDGSELSDARLESGFMERPRRFPEDAR